MLSNAITEPTCRRLTKIRLVALQPRRFYFLVNGSLDFMVKERVGRSTSSIDRKVPSAGLHRNTPAPAVLA
jgi:hypothetical protein